MRQTLWFSATQTVVLFGGSCIQLDGRTWREKPELEMQVSELREAGGLVKPWARGSGARRESGVSI